MFFTVKTFGATACTSSTITTIVLGTSDTDKYLETAGLTYQQNTASGGFWVQHVTADDGTTGNVLDGSGHLRSLILVDIHTGGVITQYRRNTTVFASVSGLTFDVMGLGSDGAAYIRRSSDGAIFRCDISFATPTYLSPTNDDSSAGLIFDSAGDMWGWNATSQKPVKLTGLNYTTHAATETDANVTAATFFRWGRNAGGIAGRVYYIFGTTIRYIDITNLAGGATDVITDAVSNLVFVIGDDSNIYYARALATGATIIVKADSNGSVLATLSVTNATQQVTELYSDGFIWVAGSTSSDNFYKINASTMTLTSTISNGSNWFRVVGFYAPGIPIVDAGGGAAFGGLAYIDCV